jgi:negative regulator of flagellin synthesis FlgM
MDISSQNAAHLRERGIGQTGQRTSAAQNPQSAAASKAADEVEISGAAQSLRRIAQDTRPPFDQARVDAIRSAIASGSYHIDPERLASNFMRIEYDIFQ